MRATISRRGGDSTRPREVRSSGIWGAVPLLVRLRMRNSRASSRSSNSSTAWRAGSSALTLARRFGSSG